jgi:isoliquiritigenin 2'-O-methyltransferase
MFDKRISADAGHQLSPFPVAFSVMMGKNIRPELGSYTTTYLSCLLILLLRFGEGFLRHPPPPLSRWAIGGERSVQNNGRYKFYLWMVAGGDPKADKKKTLETCDCGESDDFLFIPILKLASAHFVSQALYTAIKLDIPDILGDQQMSVDEIASRLGETCNGSALLRILRLLTTTHILKEETRDDTKTVQFSLTKLGKRFQKGTAEMPSMASCIQHWMERPLWISWLELPDYIMGLGGDDDSPFSMANGGKSSDYWYDEHDHPESLICANNFVRLIHTHETDAVVNGFDWTVFRHKTLVDVGGHYGGMASAIAEREPMIDCFCLDLPGVISKAPKKDNISFIPGNVFDVATIPSCDVILMKHFLDRCMWNDRDTIQILMNCHRALNPNGTLIIAEAVLPSYGTVTEDNSFPLFMDALYMLVGRESQRTETEWMTLARQSSFKIKYIQPTATPSCSLIVLGKQ